MCSFRAHTDSHMKWTSSSFHTFKIPTTVLNVRGVRFSYCNFNFSSQQTKCDWSNLCILKIRKIEHDYFHEKRKGKQHHEDSVESAHGYHYENLCPMGIYIPLHSGKEFRRSDCPIRRPISLIFPSSKYCYICEISYTWIFAKIFSWASSFFEVLPPTPSLVKVLNWTGSSASSGS